MQLDVEAGHTVLLHNWMLHRSGVNPSATPRRAFTACYMDGRTLNTWGSPFPMVWGERPSHDVCFVGQLAESRASTEEYTLSLLETNRVLQASLQEATILRPEPRGRDRAPPRRIGRPVRFFLCLLFRIRRSAPVVWEGGFVSPITERRSYARVWAPLNGPAPLLSAIKGGRRWTRKLAAPHRVYSSPATARSAGYDPGVPPGGAGVDRPCCDFRRGALDHRAREQCRAPRRLADDDPAHPAA